MRKEIERAWAAGFFDGEGSTVAAKAHGTLQVTVGNSDLQMLQRFQNAVNGLGSILGPYKSKVVGRKDMYHFKAYSETAFSVIQSLWNLISEAKRTQAMLAMTDWFFRSKKMLPRIRHYKPGM